MPTNLPPDAKKKWEEVEATRNPREKLKLLREFLSLVPRHKGTARLCVNVKKQIANLEKEIEEKKRKKIGKTGPKIFVEKEGAAQIVILGPTKAGRSSLLKTVTNAKVEVSPNPYTTRVPVPGTLDYEDVQFQIVEVPALMQGSSEGKAWGLQSLAIARNADGIILMVDLAENPVGQLSLILDEMEKARIVVNRPKGHVEIERKYMGAGLRIVVTGRLVDCTFRDVEEMLKNYGFTDGVVKVSGDAGLDEIEDAIFQSTLYKPSVIVANKIDDESAEANLKSLEAFVDGKLPIIAVSCKTKQGLEKLGQTLFRTLDVIRVYTKEPNERQFSKKPFILKSSATIQDLAKSIHSDFRENFAFAKVWSDRLVFSPQKVGSSFVLQDGDIVEIHVK
jgi:ribosome-interacting GTPase 1